jgi:N-acetylmuramoyl-L-alanine amidase
MLALVLLWPILLCGSDAPQNQSYQVMAVVDDNQVIGFRDFLFQDGKIFLPATPLFSGLRLKPEYSPDLNRVSFDISGKRLSAELKSGKADFNGEEIKFGGGFWQDNELYLCEDFLANVYARACGCQVVLEKSESIKNYQSALRLPENFKRRPVGVVVIDPGHGGDSQGANPTSSLVEKDITLQVALRLRDKLAKVPGLTVLLTRDKDETVGLDQRAEFANKKNADLFLSIHANASRSVSASGYETFFLSLNASDEDSRKLAVWENLELSGAQDQHSGELKNGGPSELDMILGDMAQSEHLAESEVFAQTIQRDLAQIMKNPNRGVKQAPFKVLMGANMPAALVEIGFITNAADQKKITDARHQEKIAEILARSILEFRDMKARKLGMVEKDEKLKTQAGPAQKRVDQDRSAQIP